LYKLCTTAKTKALHFAAQNPTATPEQYLSTPDGLVLKTVHFGQREKSLEKLASYEQARNKALEVIGEVDMHSAVPHMGKQGICKNKIVGSRWHGGKVSVRIDHDPVKGAHINVTDYRNGKGLNGKSVMIPFDATAFELKNLLAHLNSRANLEMA